jgi:hypothetical protein
MADKELKACPCGGKMELLNDQRHMKQSKAKGKADKYEDELEKCTQLLNKYWPESMSCNGYLQVAGHLKNILTRQPEQELVDALEVICGTTCVDGYSKVIEIADKALAKYKEKI